MKKQFLCLFTISLIVCMFILSKDLLAAPYYEGKRIILIVASEPGGGYDLVGRLVAKHLPKYIPGNPTIIIENMPGASGIVAANHLYNIAKPNGLTIGTVQRGLPIAQLLKAGGVKFDLRKFSWIGSAASEATVLTIRTDLPYKTLDDLKKAKSPIMLGAVSLAESSAQFAILLKEFVGFNFELVFYLSGSAAKLAIERKEVDGRSGSYSSLSPLIERGLVRPLIRGKASQPEIENLPTDQDLTTDKKGKIIMAIRSAPEQVGRPYIAPPGTPANVMDILRDAFAKVTRDPAIIEESKRLMLEMEYLPANECLKTINFILNQEEDIIKECGRYVKF